MSYNHGDNITGCFLTILISLGFIVLSCGLGLLFAFPEMWLWNWLVPKLFNGPEIEYWQMVGLNILSTLLLSRSTTVNNNNKSN